MTNAAPPAREAQRPTLSFHLTRVAVVLSISVLINYVDRGTLSIAAPVLKDDLHLSPSQLGVLLSSFFWTYSVFQIVSGWLVDRFEVNWLLAAGVLVWVVRRNADHRPGPRFRIAADRATPPRHRRVRLLPVLQ